MKFDALTRRQAQVLFDTAAAHAAEAAKKELDALRADVEARMAALQKGLAHPQQAQLLDRLVQELSAAARADADAARIEAETVAALARGEAQQVADTALAAARADGLAKLAAEQKTTATLRTSVEEAQQKVQKLQTDQSAAAQAAAKAAAQAAAAAQAEIDRTRKELEARLEQVQAARAELARVLTEAQREAAGARSEAAAHAASLKESQARVHSLEHEYTEILVARDETSRRLEAEVQRVAEQTEAIAGLRHEVGISKQEASLSKVDAEGRRQGLEAATARIRILEEEVRKATEAGGQPGPRQVVAAVAQAGKDEESGVLLLDHVGTALESIDVAISANEILETLIEQLARHFASAAVFLVGPSSFKGWKGTGLGAGTDISNIEIPRTIDSLLSRTLAERKPATVSGKAGDPAVGVLGNPVATALALPVFANGRVIAVAYAEHAEESSASLSVGCKIAEILIDHANRRLTVKRRSPGSGQGVDRLGSGTNPDERTAAYSPARQTRRIMMPEALEVTLEGSAATLVDLSTLGAQVLSPVAMRPKRIVRLILPTNEGGLTCKGRVVWAQFEQAQAGIEARHRAGLKFTEADAQAIEAYLARHGVSAHDRVLSANLEESA